MNDNKLEKNFNSDILQTTVELRFEEKIENVTLFFIDCIGILKSIFANVIEITNPILNQYNQHIGVQYSIKLSNQENMDGILFSISEGNLSFVMDSPFSSMYDYIHMVEKILSSINLPNVNINRLGVRTTLKFDIKTIYNNTNIEIKFNDEIISNNSDSILNLYYSKVQDGYNLILQSINQAQLIDLSKQIIFASVLDVDVILMQPGVDINNRLRNKEITNMHDIAVKLISKTIK